MGQSSLHFSDFDWWFWTKQLNKHVEIINTAVIENVIPFLEPMFTLSLFCHYLEWVILFTIVDRSPPVYLPVCIYFCVHLYYYLCGFCLSWSVWVRLDPSGVSGPCLVRVWSVSGPCLLSVCSVSGPFLVLVWSVSGPCLICVWSVYGPCMVRVWSVWSV